MYIVISYIDPEVDPIINIECDEEGKTLKFNTHKEASVHAVTNCAWHYKVIEI